MYYKITLTCSGGFTEENLIPFKQAFSLLENSYVVNEFGESGQNSHLEGIVEYSSEKTSNIKARIKTLYSRAGVEVVSGISIRIKQVTHLVGALIYVSKELKCPENPAKILVLKGWNQSWIDKQVKDNVKNIPHKMLTKKGHRVTQNTGGALMYEWCLANNKRITNKFDMIQVGKDMASQGYLFGSIRVTGLYQDVLSLFGSGDAVESVWENELRFL